MSISTGRARMIDWLMYKWLALLDRITRDATDAEGDPPESAYGIMEPPYDEDHTGPQVSGNSRIQRGDYKGY